MAEYVSGAPAGGGTKYLTADHLGSTRAVTDNTGAVLARHDYLPFGEEVGAGVGGRTSGMGYGVNDSTRQRFTGHERDPESGLDFMRARYCSASQGRFSSTDPIFFQKEMPIDPQRFNLYAYVRNNPLALIDPSGEAIELVGKADQRAKILDALREAVGQEAGAYLYENKVVEKDGTVRYFVGILGGGPSGTGADFGTLNRVARVVGSIIRDSSVATVELVQPGTVVTGFGGPKDRGVINSINVNAPPGISSSVDYAAKVWLLDPSYDYGKLPGNRMSVGRANPSDISLTLIHELGHVAHTWGKVIGGSRKESAVTLENWARDLRDPSGSGPRRIIHDPEDPKPGTSPFEIKLNRQ